MAGLPHPAVDHGPVDQRPITPDEVGEARQRLGAMLRGVRSADGHRAASVTAISAILAAMDGAVDLGIEGAALNALRMCVATLEEREARLSVGDRGETRH